MDVNGLEQTVQCIFSNAFESASVTRQGKELNNVQAMRPGVSDFNAAQLQNYFLTSRI